MRPRRLRSRSAGFNILELMVVVFIIGALAAIAGPDMARMVRTQRIKTSAFDVIASLTLARSEAIKRNVTVTITPTGGDWARGWRVSDANNNVVKEQGDLGSTVTVTGPANVRYASNGRLNGATAPEFALSADDVAAGSLRCIRVDLSGRPVAKEGAC
jgi:type IV fimbrial biogenesis protein FimT